MKKILTLLLLVMGTLPMIAQTPKNDMADNIVGKYIAIQNGEESKVRIVKEKDNTYTAQVYWVKNDLDKAGKKRLDTQNPDKSLRTVPCDEVVLIKGLKYNSSKSVWDGAKIYDPTRGIKANATFRFEQDGRLSVKGTVLGISETVYWTILVEEE